MRTGALCILFSILIPSIYSACYLNTLKKYLLVILNVGKNEEVNKGNVTTSEGL